MKHPLICACVALALSNPSCSRQADTTAVDIAGLQSLDILFTYESISTTEESFHIARDASGYVLQVTSSTGYPPLPLHSRRLSTQQLAGLVAALQAAPTDEADVATAIAARVDAQALRARLDSPPTSEGCNRRTWRRAVAMHTTPAALQLALNDQFQHPDARRDDHARIALSLRMKGQPPRYWTSTSQQAYMQPWHVTTSSSRSAQQDTPVWTLGISDGLRRVLPEESLAWKRLGPWMTEEILASQISGSALRRCRTQAAAQ